LSIIHVGRDQASRSGCRIAGIDSTGRCRPDRKHRRGARFRSTSLGRPPPWCSPGPRSSARSRGRPRTNGTLISSSSSTFPWMGHVRTPAASAWRMGHETGRTTGAMYGISFPIISSAGRTGVHVTTASRVPLSLLPGRSRVAVSMVAMIWQRNTISPGDEELLALLVSGVEQHPRPGLDRQLLVRRATALRDSCRAIALPTFRGRGRGRSTRTRPRATSTCAGLPGREPAAEVLRDLHGPRAPCPRRSAASMSLGRGRPPRPRRSRRSFSKRLEETPGSPCVWQAVVDDRPDVWRDVRVDGVPEYEQFPSRRGWPGRKEQRARVPQHVQELLPGHRHRPANRKSRSDMGGPPGEPRAVSEGGAVAPASLTGRGFAGVCYAAVCWALERVDEHVFEVRRRDPHLVGGQAEGSAGAGAVADEGA